MIEKGLYVKIVFKNSTQAEGIVESWSDQESILVSADNKSRFVIFNTKEDILGVKICYEEPVKHVVKNFEQTVEEFKNVQAQPSADELRLHTLAQLRNKLNEQEKKIITDKIKEHTISDIRLPQYGLPTFISKPRTK